ncbi:MAG: hypothetical protein CMP48_13800 [Rickettsiales bacterium]|nr:hypothetical protein [Rickettsiales bacterium]
MKQLFTATLLCALISVYGQKPKVQNKIKRLEQDIEALRHAPSDYRLLKCELQNEYLELVEENQSIVRDNLFTNQNLEVSNDLSLISIDSILVDKYVKSSDSFKDSVRSIISFDNSTLVKTETTYELREGEWVIINKYESFYNEDGVSLGWAYYLLNSLDELVGGSKNVFEVEDGKIISSEYLRWDSSINDWYLYSKNLSNYEGDILVYQESWNWDWDLSECVPNYRHHLTHDTEGNLLIQVTDDWSNDQQEWVPNYQYEYEYEDGKEWTYILSWWNNATEEFDLSSRRNIAYNTKGDILTEYYYSYIQDEWVYSFNTVHWYEYDSNDRIIEDLVEQSFDDGETTQKVSKSEAEYTDSGVKIVDAYFTWENDEWRLQYKFIYSLNEEEETIGYEYYYTDWSTGLVVGSFKYLNTFGENTKTVTYYKWDADNSVFLKDYSWEAHIVNDIVEYEDYYVFTNEVSSLDARKTYFRSTLFSQIEEIPTISLIAGTSAQIDLGTYFEVKTERSVEFTLESLKSLVNPSIDGNTVTLAAGTDEGIDSIQLTIKVAGLAAQEAYIIVEVNKVLSAKANGVEVFPNPSADFVSVRNKEFTSAANYQLISLGGQLVAFGKVANVISLEGVEKGTYVLRLEEDGKTVSYRIIKK